MGDSVLLPEIDSDDYLKSVQGFIDYVQNVAWPQLQKNVRATEQLVREQVQEQSDQQGPLNALKAEKKKLEDQVEKEYEKAYRERAKASGYSSALAPSAGGADDKGKKGKADISGLKFKEAVAGIDAERDRKVANIKADIEEKEREIKEKERQYANMPNERVYDDAFAALRQAMELYKEGLKVRAAKVMKARGDGPLVDIDPDALQDASDKVGKLFRDIEKAFKDMVTYRRTTATNEVNTVKLFDASMEIEFLNIEGASERRRPGKYAVYERIRLNRLNAVNEVAYEMELLHKQIEDRLSRPMSLSASLDRYDIGVLYALKLSRLGLLFSASFVATRVFNNIYVERASVKEPDVPDLKWMAFAFMVTAMLFDGVIVGIAFFLSSIVPTRLDRAVVKDLLIDTVVAHTMTGLSLFSIADVIQDKKYFDYQVAAPRALRLMRQMCFTLSGFHALIPYFYLTGPFYIQYKQAATETAL